MGSGAKPQPLFLSLRLFSMKMNILLIHGIIHHGISTACTNSDEKTLNFPTVVPTAQLLIRDAKLL